MSHAAQSEKAYQLSRDYKLNPIKPQEKINPKDFSYLYLTKNLSCTEIGEIFGCPAYKVQRFKRLNNINKPKSLSKACRGRLQKEILAKRIPEQKAKTAEKVRKTWHNQSAEKKEKIRKLKSENSKKNVGK